MNKLCKSIRDKFALLFAGESGAEQTKFVKAHLADCAGCREAYKLFQERTRSESIAEADDRFARLVDGMDRRFDMDEVRRLRKREMIAGGNSAMTADEVAQAPLEESLYRNRRRSDLASGFFARLLAPHPAWRWAGILGSSVAAVALITVLVSRYPQMPGSAWQINIDPEGGDMSRRISIPMEKTDSAITSTTAGTDAGATAGTTADATADAISDIKIETARPDNQTALSLNDAEPVVAIEPTIMAPPAIEPMAIEVKAPATPPAPSPETETEVDAVASESAMDFVEEIASPPVKLYNATDLVALDEAYEKEHRTRAESGYAAPDQSQAEPVQSATQSAFRSAPQPATTSTFQSMTEAKGMILHLLNELTLDTRPEIAGISDDEFIRRLEEAEATLSQRSSRSLRSIRPKRSADSAFPRFSQAVDYWLAVGEGWFLLCSEKPDSQNLQYYLGKSIAACQRIEQLHENAAEISRDGTESEAAAADSLLEHVLDPATMARISDRIFSLKQLQK